MISIYTGVTGLKAHEQAVDVIANNIANINTTGFKAARANFQEALSQTLRAASAAGGGRGTRNPMQLGLGSQIGSIDNLMTQGNLKFTGNTMDLAIQGNGFFLLSDNSGEYLTRNGSFALDGNNRLVSAGSGLALLGWQADPITGAIPSNEMITPSSYLTIPVGVMSIAKPTANVAYQANLDAAAAAGTTVDTSCYVYDSLGVQHRVDITFTKSATDNEWAWAASGPDADPAVPGSTGTLIFDANGQITTPAFNLSVTLAASGGATNPVDAGLSFAGVTQLAGASTVQAVSQDGLPMGTLQSFSIDNQGVITGTFTNGMFRTLGQVALARFANPAGLNKVGNSLWQASVASGPPAVVWPSTGDAGTLASGYLELSNVDLAAEFANLIVTQRGFQANSRVITTSDEMLQELLTIKR
jgi:flagellar hook protein FlgE